MNGEVWDAVNELRRDNAARQAENAVLARDIHELKDDLNGVGSKMAILNDRCATSEELAAVNARIESWARTLRWLVALAVPTISALIGALVQSG
jgi:hypothetical protein